MGKIIAKIYGKLRYTDYIASGLLSWSIVMGLFLRKDISLGIGSIVVSIMISIILLPMIMGLVRCFSHFFDKLNSIKSSERKVSDKKIFGFVMVLLLICWLPYFLAYYPGIFAYDVGNQMRQITTGVYHTKHPLLHTFLIQIFYQLGEVMHSYTLGIALYSVFQMLLLASFISYAYVQLYDLNVGKKIRYIVLLYYALFPVHGMLSISVTKDVLFSGLVLLFSVLYYKQFIKNETTRCGICILIIVTVTMCLYRNNAIYAFVLSGIINILLYLKDKLKRKQLLQFSFVVIMLFFAVNTLLIKVTDAQQGSIRESLAVPFQQISRTYNVHMNELDENEKREIEELIPDVLMYNPIIADPVKSKANVRDNERRIMKLWGRLLVRYPFTYVEAFLYNSYGSWFIDDTTNAFVYDNPGESRRGYLISFCNGEYGVEHTSYFGIWEDVCERLFSYNDYQKVPIVRMIFAPALYFWIVFLITIDAWGKKMKGVVFSTIFLLMYHFTIMCGPCCLVRYLYPLMITVPFIIGIYLSEKEKMLERI